MQGESQLLYAGRMATKALASTRRIQSRQAQAMETVLPRHKGQSGMQIKCATIDRHCPSRQIIAMANKIHFISHVEKSYEAVNLGDWICSPYSYFPSFFSQYTCVFHSHWNILWHEIDKGDVVILGGGGQLDNSDALNEQINRLIRNCDNVVIWGSGTHRYAPGNIFNKKTAEVPIQYEKAKLVGVRDYNHPSGLPYVPCVSCMHPAFTEALGQSTYSGGGADHKRRVRRKVGTIRSALEASFAVNSLPSYVDNSQPLQKILQYALESEIILVSSYHGAYWSHLLGLKAILPETRLGVDKYKYFKNQTAFYKGSVFDEDAMMALANEIEAPVDFLNESRTLSNEFFEKVKSLIKTVLIETDPSDIQTLQIMAKRNAQLEFTLKETWGFIKHMNHRLSKIEQASGNSSS